MDDGLDDLFGDASPLQLPDPLPKGLLQRADELSLNGCCQYVERFYLIGESLKRAKEVNVVQDWMHCVC